MQIVLFFMHLDLAIFPLVICDFGINESILLQNGKNISPNNCTVLVLILVYQALVFFR